MSVLVGTAVGDALGLPREGLPPDASPLRHAFLFGRGWVSDDTEHAFLTTQAFLAAPDDVQRFRRALAWRLRGWLAAGPPAIGFATLRALIGAWLGRRRGVRSAGNGAVMRAPALGVALASDPERRRAFVRASTEITHTDPRAVTGALAIAELAAWAAAHPGARPDWVTVAATLRPLGDDAEWARAVAHTGEALAAGESVGALAERLGSPGGVSGYVYHTVPAAVFAWLRHPDPAEALTQTIGAGGDTDSVGALVGALCGAGGAAFPGEWVAGIADWPLSVAVLRDAEAALAAGGRPVRWAWPALPLRNLAFGAVAIAHVLARWGRQVAALSQAR